MFNILNNLDTLISIITLILIEIILGIDNILFLVVLIEKLPKYQHKKARYIGLTLSMVFRLILLFFISLILNFEGPVFYIENNIFRWSISIKNLFFITGSLFIVYKSFKEIYISNIKKESLKNDKTILKKPSNFLKIIVQIVLLDMIFSIDSLLTAINIIKIKDYSNIFYSNKIMIIIFSIVFTSIIMIFFSKFISFFVKKYPSFKTLGLFFLILIGFIIIIKELEEGNYSMFKYSIKNIPKNYLYILLFSFFTMEFFNKIIMEKK